MRCLVPEITLQLTFFWKTRLELKKPAPDSPKPRVHTKRLKQSVEPSSTSEVEHSYEVEANLTKEQWLEKFKLHLNMAKHHRNRETARLIERARGSLSQADFLWVIDNLKDHTEFQLLIDFGDAAAVGS